MRILLDNQELLMNMFIEEIMIKMENMPLKLRMGTSLGGLSKKKKRKKMKKMKKKKKMIKKNQKKKNWIHLKI